MNGHSSLRSISTAPMTSRERVAKAVNFQVPDRVPIDLGGLKASGIAVAAYDRLKKHLEIRTPSHVREQLRAFAPGGGYVFNQAHNIQANVPLENIIAMFNAAYEHNLYGGEKTREGALPC